MIRARPVLAVTQRDLAQVFRGRRGLGFLGITALLLLPAATVRINRGQTTEIMERVTFAVSGDVPQRVLDSGRAVVVPPEQSPLHFEQSDQGPLVVRGVDVPRPIRDALDGDEPAVRVEMKIQGVAVPKRSLLYGLISASILTGALSESIPGERSRRTLGSLLAAAITRLEVVLGKWAAWTGYGVLAALAAAIGAILAGRSPLGWWLLPMVMVPACTVAVGLYLVRQARDVVGGATVSLRVVPAVLGATGVAAWMLGQTHPLLGAALPLGGALVTSGATWGGLAPPLVATLSTGLTTALLLWLTARDLEQDPPRERPSERPWASVLGVVSLAAPASWAALAGALLWGPAGNPAVVEGISRVPGAMAAGGLLLVMAGLRAGRSAEPAASLGLVRAPTWAWAAALGAGVALLGATWLQGVAPLPADGLLALAGERVSDGLHPTWAGVGAVLLVAAGQELVFRGWLQQTAGPVLATLAFALVCSPLDPLPALVAGGLLAGLVRVTGSTWPALAARVVWLGAVLTLA